MKSNTKASIKSKVKAARFRRSLLATSCVLAMGAGSAVAQTSTYLYDPVTPPIQTQLPLSGFLIEDLNIQINTAIGIGIAASSNNILMGVTLSPIILPGVPAPATVTNNSVLATAAGNTYSTPAGSPAPPAGPVLLGTLGTGDSLGVFSGQVQGGLAAMPVTSDITNGDVRISVSQLDSRTNILSGNKVEASTTLNQSTQTASGQLPIGYSNSQTGSIVASSTTTINSTITGSIAVITHQNALDGGARAGSHATVSGSDIALTLSQTTGGPITASQTVNTNTIAADFQGNSSTNVFEAAAGSAPVAGSVVVSNGQSNAEVALIGGSAAALTASVATSAIGADFRFGIAANATELNGPLVVSGNTISASSTGNNATETSVGSTFAGNAIILGKGVDLAGVGSSRNNQLTIGASTLSARVEADLALLNAQGNQGVLGTTGLNSTVNAGAIKVQGDNLLAGGTISLSTNTVAASVTGNDAINRIQTDGINVTGSVAAANLQVNDAVQMIATNTGANISVNVGTLVGAPDVSGTVTANGNAISALAQGSSASTIVSLGATNLTLVSSDTGAVANTAGFGAVSTTTGVGATASNMQGNYGAAVPITSTVTGGNVQANFVDQLGGVTQVGLNAATVTLNGNSITSAATGNNAFTGLAAGQAPIFDINGVLIAAGTTNVSGSAAVVNGQFNGNLISGTVTNSGVSINALDSVGSNLTANSNTLSASGTANSAVNSLTANASTLTVLASPFVATGAAATNSTAGTSTSGAAFALASGQRNEAAVVSSNISSSPFVAIDITGGAGIDGGNLTVESNTVSSTTRGNIVSNTLGLTDDNLFTSTGTAGQVASLSTFQQNAVTGTSTATVQKTGGNLALGITYDGAVDTANLTVSTNAVAASNTGNSSTNMLNVAVNNYGSTAGATSGVLSSTPQVSPDTVSLVNNEFALVNRQIDSVSGGRTATVQGVNLGIETNAGGSGITNSNQTVSSNSLTALARNNDSSNVLAVAGADSSTLTTGAGLLNDQSSTTAVGATITQSRIRIQTGTGAIADSNLSVSSNLISGEAVGNATGNLLAISSTNLTGNASVPATGGASINGGTGLLTINSDFGLGNVQRQTGDVTSTVRSGMRINFNNSNTTDGSLTMTGNAVKAVAQSNSATNDAVLAGTNVTASAAIASYQSGTGVVQAVQTTQVVENTTFGMIGTSTTDTPVTVSNNAVFVAAGQNEAFSTLIVQGTTLAGQGFNNPSAYDATTGIAITGSDFSITNVQTGLGSVSSSATAGLIGTRIESITGSSLAVSGNTVTSRALVNNTVNSLVLNASSPGATLTATGAVNNVQTNTAGTGVSASILATDIGIAPQTGGSVVLANTLATISGNTLAAAAGGNTANNSLEATATASIGGSLVAPTFAVLNYQNNAAAVSANVTTATIGVNINTAGSDIQNSTLSVIGNNIRATGYGNSATNSLAMTSLVGTGNQASASLYNRQVNTGTVTTTITGANIGIFGSISTAGGGASVVSGNTSLAQSVGNSATNTISSR